jgi:hypothetical protein
VPLIVAKETPKRRTVKRTPLTSLDGLGDDRAFNAHYVGGTTVVYN